MRRSVAKRGFTLIELLTVVAIIVVLAALILHGMGYAQQKAAASRASAEIHAIGLLNESFKIDYGEYVTSDSSNGLDPSTTKPSDGAYSQSAAYLSLYLLGPAALHSSADDNDINVKVFKKFWRAYGGAWKGDGLSTSAITLTVPNIHKGSATKPEEALDTITVPIRYVIDPFGYSYGYSTKGVFNPTFDLWSAAGTTDKTAAMQLKWVKNW